jgi:hypothetical protein
MEIESHPDALTVTWPKARAEALPAAGEYGMRLIEAMGTIQRLGPMEGALSAVRDQIRKARGKSVTITLTRGEASLVDKAVVTGHQGAEAGEPAEPAPGELCELQRALSLIDAPDPKNMIVQRRRK